MDKIEVVPFDARWADQFAKEKTDIERVFGSKVIVHHIGSTSVPGLDAKPIIDIICVVPDFEDSVQKLESLGYEFKGNFFNIPLQYLFIRRTGISVNLHVFDDEQHPELELALAFRDALRADKKLRDDYVALKHRLLENSAVQENHESGFVNYTLCKRPFIYEALRFLKIQKVRLLLSKTPYEQEAYRRFGDPEESETASSFVIYQGVDVIGATQVSSKDVLFFAIEPAHAHHKDEIFSWIDRWSAFQKAA